MADTKHIAQQTYRLDGKTYFRGQPIPADVVKEHSLQNVTNAPDVEEADSGGEDTPLDDLNFASEGTKQKALDADLTPADFDDMEEGGKTGYTSDQVQGLIDGQSENEGGGS